jgi:hypothetical protein
MPLAKNHASVFCLRDKIVVGAEYEISDSRVSVVLEPRLRKVSREEPREDKVLGIPPNQIQHK